jgi:hypothetical protein
MAVYTSAIGQLVLAALLVAGALCIWWLDRLARPYRPARFFIHKEAG